MSHTHPSPRTALVTGATSGIGVETARALAALGWRVLVHARSRTRGAATRDDIVRTTGNENVHVLLADLSSMDEVRRLAADVRARFDALHVLVNNAGVFLRDRSLTVDGFERTFAINHLAPFVLTRELLPLLEASAPARVVTVSSVAHWSGRLALDDIHLEHGYSSLRAYGRSKLANIMFTHALARRLSGTGVTATCLHPGVIPTRLGSETVNLFSVFYRTLGAFMIGPERGARTSVYLASSPDVEGVSGAYFVRCKKRMSSPLSRRMDLQERLWELSEGLTGRWGEAAEDRRVDVSVHPARTEHSSTVDEDVHRPV
jgi:retinol dehydrogenase 14